MTMEELRLKLQTMGRCDKILIDNYCISRTPIYPNGFLVESMKSANIFSSIDRVINFLKEQKKKNAENY